MRSSFLFSLILTAALGCSSKVTNFAENRPQKADSYVRGEKLRVLYGKVEGEWVTNYMAGIVSRLWGARPAPSEGKSLFKVELLSSKEPVAFSPGDGSVLLSAGLISSLETEGELAFVISHEMAHIILNHQALIDDESTDVELRQEIEVEADKLGLEILTRAGYDPNEALSGLIHSYASLAKLLPNRSMLNIDEISATYPALGERFSALGVEISKAPKTNTARFPHYRFLQLKRLLSGIR